MIVYIYQNESTGTVSFSTKPGEDGYSRHHPETGLPYGDSFRILHSVWDVPEAYEANAGDIIVPYSGPYCSHDKFMGIRKDEFKTCKRHVPWSSIWPIKPHGATKLED